MNNQNNLFNNRFCDTYPEKYITKCLEILNAYQVLTNFSLKIYCDSRQAIIIFYTFKIVQCYKMKRDEKINLINYDLVINYILT